jgi:hypothetical protein
MSDTPSNGKRIVSLDDHIPKSRRDRMQRSPSTEEVKNWIQAGSITAMKQVYEALASENSRLFAQMEQIAVDRVLAEIERRSWRGRVKALWQRVRKAKPELVPDVPAVPVPEEMP